MRRIGGELVMALLRTEAIGLALVLQAGFARIQWRRHAANRVLDRRRISVGLCVTVTVMAVIMLFGLVHSVYFNFPALMIV